MRPVVDLDEIKHALSDPRDVCSRLGLLEGARPQGGGGLLIRCPAHAERTASCSITRAERGWIRVRCFGCTFAGDVLHLVAAVNEIDARVRFADVVAMAAQLASVSPSVKRSWREPPPRQYPPIDEIAAVWARAGSVYDDAQVSAWLRGRGLDPGRVADEDAARVLVGGANWAVFNGQTWRETGHHLLLPVFDEQGAMRSLRACRVVENETPKRLPPAGHKAAGLVLACPVGRQVLAAGTNPDWNLALKVLVVEGEPDFLVWSAQQRTHERLDDLAIFGVMSGGWSTQIAQRIPDDTQVIVRTHHDDAGDGYAMGVAESLGRRCTVIRPGGAS